MKESSIEVSIIIPVYNEEKRIEECIYSLINQTYTLGDMEWIIVDGCSTDRTKAIIEKYAKQYPIKLFVNEKRKTPISMNLGIKNSHGKYIIRLDAHASFPSDYVEKCVHYLNTTDADNVGGYVDTKAEGFVGVAIAKMLSSKFGVGGSSFRTGDKEGYVDTVPFGAFRREVFDKVGLFNENLLRSEDNDMNARIRLAGGKIFLTHDIVSTYYCRDSISGLLKMGLQNGNALFRTIRFNPKAMSVRHFIPFVFLLSLVIIPTIGLFVPFFRWAFLIELLCYFALDFFFSFGKKQKKYGIVTFWLYPLFHVSYGCGSLLGLFGMDLY